HPAGDERRFVAKSQRVPPWDAVRCLGVPRRVLPGARASAVTIARARGLRPWSPRHDRPRGGRAERQVRGAPALSSPLPREAHQVGAHAARAPLWRRDRGEVDRTRARSERGSGRLASLPHPEAAARVHRTLDRARRRVRIMSAPGVPDRELIEDFEAVLEGSASPEVRRRLAARLERDPAARAWYLRHVEIHAMLEFEHGLAGRPRVSASSLPAGLPELIMPRRRP